MNLVKEFLILNFKEYPYFLKEGDIEKLILLLFFLESHKLFGLL